MADHADPMRILVLALLALVVVFLAASIFQQRQFIGQVFWSIVIVVLVILILARFGGDIGRTV